MRQYDYQQTLIGDCGHPCQGWPQLSKLGSSEVRVICNACTIQEYGLDPDVDDSLAVWVRVEPEPETKPTPVKPRKKTEKRIPQHGLWGAFTNG